MARYERVPEPPSRGACEYCYKHEAAIEQEIEPYHEMADIISYSSASGSKYLQQLKQNGELRQEHDGAIDNHDVVYILKNISPPSIARLHMYADGWMNERDIVPKQNINYFKSE